MKEIERHNFQCPECQNSLSVKSLHCHDCDLTMEGNFIENEFASLGQDEVHFLRVFVFCEGKIGDMERALGVSYPTVKSKLKKLKSKLQSVSESSQKKTNDTKDILKAIESGEMSVEKAVELIKNKV
ncbi:MAG: DUF2089 family protein [Bacteriovoracaceae bacterium]|jgi:hypothetical protein|nr:DUF2089 family protein [Bacteriovoracaceae bacterium]